MIKGSCHCGAVGWEYDGIPTHLTACNCSICRRVAALWGYGTVQSIRITGQADATLAYVQGDRMLAVHTCLTCGCTSHWASLTEDGNQRRMAVNMRLADPADIAEIRVRRFDGADSWEFLD